MSSDWLQVSLRAGFLPSCHWLYFSIHISYFSHLRKHLWYSLSQLQLVPPQLQAGYKPHYSVQDIYQKPYSESDLQQLSNSKLWKCRWIPRFFWFKSCECPPCFPLFMVLFTTRAPNSHPTRPVGIFRASQVPRQRSPGTSGPSLRSPSPDGMFPTDTWMPPGFAQKFGRILEKHLQIWWDKPEKPLKFRDNPSNFMVLRHCFPMQQLKCLISL
jgi:hypothetical protein